MLRAMVAAALVMALCGSAVADTLLLRDGRKFTGLVTQTDGGYTVQTRFGVMTASKDEVQEWVKGDSPPATAPTTGPAVARRAAHPAKPTTRAVGAPLVLPPPTPRPHVAQSAVAFAITEDEAVTVAPGIDSSAKVSLEGRDGIPVAADVVRTDPVTGLVLLRVNTGKLHPLPLADAFAGGDVQCACYPKASLFSPTPQMIDGHASAPVPHWSIRLERHPRLAAAPILSEGRVVGIELAEPKGDLEKVPALSLDILRKFLAEDLPLAVEADPDPLSGVLQCTIR